MENTDIFEDKSLFRKLFIFQSASLITFWVPRMKKGAFCFKNAYFTNFKWLFQRLIPESFLLFEAHGLVL